MDARYDSEPDGATLACNGQGTRPTRWTDTLYPNNRRDDARRLKVLAAKKANIASRLKRVCAYMDPEEFDGLVERMAILDLKYSVRRDDDLFRSRPSATSSWPDGS
jgi:hypothetical protein